MNDIKKPWQSKTIVLNAIIGLATFAALIIPSAASIKDFINSNAVTIGAVWSVLNIILRTISKDKISLID